MQNGFLPGQRRVSRDTSKEGGRRCEKTVPVCAARSSEGGKKRTAARWRTVITQEIKCRVAGCLARQLAEEARPLAEHRVKYVDRCCHTSAPDAQCVPFAAHEIHKFRPLLRTVLREDRSFARSIRKMPVLGEKEIRRPLGDLLPEDLFEFPSCRAGTIKLERSARIFGSFGSVNSFRGFFRAPIRRSALDLARVAAPLSLEYTTRSHSRREMIAG
jgi:hypothetical protein